MNDITNKIVLEMNKSAKKLNLEFNFLYGTFFTVSSQKTKLLFSETTPQTTNSPIAQMSDNKFIMNSFLKKGGFPILPSEIINDTTQAKNFISKNGSAVIKPIHGIHGKGVSVNVGLNDDLEFAIKHAKRNDKSKKSDVLIEKFCNGTEYRILVIGKSIFVTKKEPAFFVANGKNTVKEQIAMLEKLPGSRFPIKITKQVVQTLLSQGYNLDDIPPKNSKVIIKKIANLKSGAITTAQPRPVDKKFQNLGITLAKYTSLDVVGIDIMIDNSGKIYILEINIDPGIRLHMEPTYGPTYNVCDEILNYFFNKKYEEKNRVL